MVTPPTNQPNVLTRLLRETEPEQLRLPMEVPGERGAKVIRNAKAFAFGFMPKIGSSLLMRAGVPMVAATTPLVIHLVDPEWGDELIPNLLVGSGLGGAYGAAVGAIIPRYSGGVRVSRISAAGHGAASGVLLAPAVAMVSKFVTDFITAPLERARDSAEDRADEAERDLEDEQESNAKPGAGG